VWASGARNSGLRARARPLLTKTLAACDWPAASQPYLDPLRVLGGSTGATGRWSSGLNPIESDWVVVSVSRHAPHGNPVRISLIGYELSPEVFAEAGGSTSGVGTHRLL